MNTTKLYNVIIDALLILLFGIALIGVFALAPNDNPEHFIIFLIVKVFMFILLLVSYYGLHTRGVLTKLSK